MPAAVRLDRLMAGVGASLIAALGSTSTVLWAPSEWPVTTTTTGALAVAKLIGGPSSSPLGGESVREVELPTEARVVLTGAGTVRLRVAGMWWEATSRDALLAAIAAEPYTEALFAPDGLDAIEIAGNLGDLYDLGVSGPATLTVLATERGVAQTSEVQATVEVQVYAAQRYPHGGAADLLSRWLGTLFLPSSERIFERFGLAVLGPRPGVVDLTTLGGGPDWEGRAAVRLPIGMISLAVETLEPIERVTMGFTGIGQPPDPITFNAEAELP